MDKKPSAPRPGAAQSLEGHRLPGKPSVNDARPLPRAIIGRVHGRERSGALPVPADRRVSAFTKPAVVERWGVEAAGVRPSALATGDNVITMFDDIGEDFWTGGGVTAKGVSAQLRAIGDRPIELQINSSGGDVFEGFAIYNVLREHSQEITVKIMGMAASAASVIAMAGNRIEIGAASFLMIHNCWCSAVGNRHDFMEIAAFLEPFDLAMAQVYANQASQDLSAIQKWMDDETFMSGALAIERGFADALLPADQMTRDDKAKAHDRSVNELRAMELQLVSTGLTRTEARAKIAKIKGTPGAAQDAVDTPGAADTVMAQAAGFSFT